MCFSKHIIIMKMKRFETFILNYVQGINIHYINSLRPSDAYMRQ